MENIGPYVNGYIINFGEGEVAMDRDFINMDVGLDDKTHIVVEGDTLRSISHEHYGDGSYWYLLADVNNILDIWDLTLGSELHIPDKKRLDVGF